MEINLIPNSTIAKITGLIEAKDCQLLVEAISKYRSLGMEDHFKDMTAEGGRDFWRDKNTFLNNLGGAYQSVLDSLEAAKSRAFKEYLKILGDSSEYEQQPFGAAHTWGVGMDMPVHVDQYDDNSKVRYGFIFYLNGDFEGGELYYPDHNIEIKPEAGLLVIHSSKVAHGVRQVTARERHNMTSFALALK